MNKNKVFKFAKPMNENESLERFHVVEDRGERVLVTEIHSEHMTVVPTFCYLFSDLVEAN